MGTIKIEFDLPEFKDNLELNILIKRDGEVIATSSSSSMNNKPPTNLANPTVVPQQIPSQVANGGVTVNNNVGNVVPNIPKSMVDLNI